MIHEDLKPYINRYVSFTQINGTGSVVGIVNRGILIRHKSIYGEEYLICCYKSSENPDAIQGAYPKEFPKGCDASWSMGISIKCYRNLSSAEILGEI